MVIQYHTLVIDMSRFGFIKEVIWLTYVSDPDVSVCKTHYSDIAYFS